MFCFQRQSKEMSLQDLGTIRRQLEQSNYRIHSDTLNAIIRVKREVSSLFTDITS